MATLGAVPRRRGCGALTRPSRMGVMPVRLCGARLAIFLPERFVVPRSLHVQAAVDGVDLAGDVGRFGVGQELGRARAWGERLSGATASGASSGRRQAS